MPQLEKFSFGDVLAVVSNKTYLWVTDYKSFLYKIKIKTNKLIKKIKVGKNPYGIAINSKYVWVLNAGDNSVSKINISTNISEMFIRLSNKASVSGISSDETNVWVTDSSNGVVYKISCLTGKIVNTIEVGANPTGISSDGKNVWVANNSGGNIGSVSQINCSSGKVVNTIKVGRSPFGISSDGINVWVTNNNLSNSGTVSQINCSTSKVVNTIKVGKSPFGISSDGINVWVTNNNGSNSSVSQISTVLFKNVENYTVNGLFQAEYTLNNIFSDGANVWTLVSSPQNGVHKIVCPKPYGDPKGTITIN
jgi:YVTN family beta-propeller protein